MDYKNEILQFTSKGIYCIPGRFYIDPWQPVAKALITHGHADHARPGMKDYLCHDYSVHILKSRLGTNISVQGISYHTPLMINDVQVSFHPAGHIIGSAQIRLEYKGKVALVTGDYKIQDDGISTAFELVKCHELITESTFALPIYNWLEVEEQNQLIRNWVSENLAQGRSSIVVGYSLGKAQRIMKALEDIGEIHVHYSISKLNEAISSCGIKLPDYKTIDLRENIVDKGKTILVVPPSLVGSQIIKKFSNAATAICSGWMQIRGARRWKSADAGFPISDHADWPGLLQVIKGTEAERVYVTHGYKEALSRYLNEIGIHSEILNTEFGNEEDPISIDNKA